MTLNIPRVQYYLKSFKLEKLFIEELGWDRHSGKIQSDVYEKSYSLTALAEKRGIQIFQCLPDNGNDIPDYATRRKIEKQVTKSAYEHLIIFIDAAQTVQIWQWVSRQSGLRAAYREHHYHPKRQSGDSLIQKLQSITFSLSEEEGLTLTEGVFKLRDAFDRDRVTKKFYDHFKKQHGAFLDFIKGVTKKGDREWYASLMLNRLMFIYFIQKKGFLDSDLGYLKNRLEMVQKRRGKGKFLSFYRYFLIRLFHEGFSQQPKQRKKELEDLLGEVPYLNGGLFELHTLEQNYPKIDIPDDAFEQLFAFFDQYEWHLDNRPLSNDKEINPDVLGYIFEKYINQKQMGAYYTKEDITEYISKNTVIPYLFNAARKKCAVAFQPDASLWRLLKNDPLRYIYPAMTRGVLDTNGDVIPLPGKISEGIKNVAKREGWNKPADPEYALPTETWREHVARRQRCLGIIDKLAKGEICQINDLITYNLDIRQFAEDAITECESPELLKAFYQSISAVTVLDPTCGSGAFLFAALNILEPLYDACLDRMQGFIDDLERSGKRYRSDKFSNFRGVLNEIEKHPNRHFFILKSIVVNNLYGVDIMEEAVEICKLRLFLKLVAQVDKVKQLEPLPDIDFNIQVGNTLVGFVTVNEIRKAAEFSAGGQGKLPFTDTLDEVQRIEEDAGIVELAFKRFHEMQTEQGMDAQNFKTAKEALREKLKKLSDQLDEYLAKDYVVNLKKKKVFEDWRSSHQPFHWFVEFYGIMSRGGFDVVIGNPPYVEYRNVRSQYQITQYLTEPCGNLYAFTWERCLKISFPKGYIGMIIPVAAVCTDGYKPLQKLLNNSGTSIVSSYNDRPSKLFDGLEHIRLCIILHEKNTSIKRVFSSGYLKWQSTERPHLFERLSFIETTELNRSGCIAKIGTAIEASLLAKIGKEKVKLSEFVSKYGKHQIFYTRKLSHFVQILDFVPAIFDKINRQREPSELKNISFKKSKERDIFLSALNSTLFYWLLTVYSDCRNLNKREVDSMRFNIRETNSSLAKKLIELSNELMKDIKHKSNFLEMNYKKHGQLRIQCTYPKLSKNIIDRIDKLIGDSFGFSEEELDFIINYDIKYRMG